MPIRRIPAISGFVALLITFVVLRWAWWLGLFTSVFGLMMAAVVAHGVGTAVAMVVDLPSARRSVRAMCWRVVVAAFCALFLWSVISTLIHSWPRVFYVPIPGVVGAAVIAYALCAVVARRVEPAWHRYAGPLALVAVVVTSIIVIVSTSYTAQPQPGGLPGGANEPGPPPRGGPSQQ